MAFGFVSDFDIRNSDFRRNGRQIGGAASKRRFAIGAILRYIALWQIHR
jgi:hypothetical protein